MNIYEKLQTMRVELQKMKLTKSGKNKFAGYSYYELGDFIPQINELMLKHKVTSVIKYEALASLTLIDIEKPEETIKFTSPMSSASLKGCHEVQNLGAVETYLRRYLYTTAFEIVEQDALDSTQGKEEPQERPKGVSSANADKTCTEKQRKLIYLLYKKKNNEEMTDQSKEMIRKLTMSKASEMIDKWNKELEEVPEKQVDDIEDRNYDSAKEDMRIKNGDDSDEMEEEIDKIFDQE